MGLWWDFLFLFLGWWIGHLDTNPPVSWRGYPTRMVSGSALIAWGNRVILQPWRGGVVICLLQQTTMDLSLVFLFFKLCLWFYLGLLLILIVFSIFIPKTEYYFIFNLFFKVHFFQKRSFPLTPFSKIKNAFSRKKDWSGDEIL